MLFFISEDQEMEAPGWRGALTDYLSTVDTGSYLQLDTGHYVHYEEADVIARESKAFLQGTR